jgi:ATP-dependent DNA ligase
MIPDASNAGATAGLGFFVFDLLHLDGDTPHRAIADRAKEFNKLVK